MDDPVIVHDLQGISIVREENNISKRNPDNLVFNPVVIADFECTFSEFLIPLYAAEQFMNRYHREAFRFALRLHFQG